MPRKKVVDDALMDEAVRRGAVREGSTAHVVGVDVKSTLRVRRVPVDSTRVVTLDLTPGELRALLASQMPPVGRDNDPDAIPSLRSWPHLEGALVWVRCRVPEGEAASSAEDVRAYLKAAGARSARVDVSEVAARREKPERSGVAKLASARERMDWWLVKSLAAASVRAEVARVMDAEDVR